MLTAVPAQLAPQDHREAAFERAAKDALADLGGTEAVAHILRLYRADTAALHAHICGVEREASEAARSERRHWDMLMQIQAGVSQGIFERAGMGAEVATLREMFGAIREIVYRAGGGTLDSSAVAAVLALEPLEPVHQPVVTAFSPSEQYRGGQFRSTDGTVTRVFTFIGWALVDHGLGALGSLEPMFLVSDRAMPKSAIEAELPVTMERLLDQFPPPRAA
jgi:hypothetical protein